MDAPALARLVNLAYRGESSRAGWTTEADLLDGVRTSEDEMRALCEAGEIVCADVAGALVGCYRYESDPLGSDDAYLGMVTVEPTLQRCGLGKQLIADAEERARVEDRPGLVMWVIDVRDELLAFYARRGYFDTGAREPFPYDDPGAGIPKRKDLRFAILRKELA